MKLQTYRMDGTGRLLNLSRCGLKRPNVMDKAMIPGDIVKYMGSYDGCPVELPQPVGLILWARWSNDPEAIGVMHHVASHRSS